MKKHIFNACKITTIVDFFILGKAIMFMLGEMIPKLKGRQSKGATADSGSGQSISANKKNKKKKKGKWTKTTKQNFAVKKTLWHSLAHFQMILNDKSSFCRRIVWVCLTILWNWRLKG